MIAYVPLLIAILLYLSLGAGLLFLIGRRGLTPNRQAILRATVVAAFLSFGLVIGHGAAALPVLVILIMCLSGECWKMYGGFAGLFAFVLLPLLVQWMIVVSAWMGARYLRKKWDRMPWW